MVNKWKRFEEEKKRLESLDLTPAEYEQEIRLLCQRLEI